MAINSRKNRFFNKNRQKSRFLPRFGVDFLPGSAILAVWQEVFKNFLKKFLRHKKGQKAGSKAGAESFYKNSDAKGIPIWGRVLLKIHGS